MRQCLGGEALGPVEVAGETRLAAGRGHEQLSSRSVRIAEEVGRGRVPRPRSRVPALGSPPRELCIAARYERFGHTARVAQASASARAAMQPALRLLGDTEVPHALGEAESPGSARSQQRWPLASSSRATLMFGSSSWRRRRTSAWSSRRMSIRPPQSRTQSACARRTAGTASLARRSSAPNSRIVSSIQKRSAGAAEQALLDQGLKVVDVSVDDLLGRLEREAAGEDGELREELLARSGESSSYDHSIVARSVCWRGSASRPPLRRSSRCSEAVEDLRWRQRPCPRRSELDCQRHLVEPAAEVARSSAVGSIPDRSAEERDCLPLGQWRYLVLDLAAYAQQLPGGDEQDQVRAAPRPAPRAPAPSRPPAPGCRAATAALARRCTRQVRLSPRAV